MCYNFLKSFSSTPIQQVINFDFVLTKQFNMTFNYLFDTIKVTTKKSDMVRL